MDGETRGRGDGGKQAGHGRNGTERALTPNPLARGDGTGEAGAGSPHYGDTTRGIFP
jgi:hypothetical protein